jgi:hypothetical protein
MLGKIMILSRIRGFAWQIIMGSGLDVWIYWHFFTITVDYDNLKSMTVYDSLHSLLDHDCLLFQCDEIRTTNHCSHLEQPWTTSVWRFTPTNELLLFITSKRPEYSSPSRTVPLLFCYPLPRKSVFVNICCHGHASIRGNALTFTSVSVAADVCVYWTVAEQIVKLPQYQSR